jgi:hypothetical protein
LEVAVTFVALTSPVAFNAPVLTVVAVSVVSVVPSLLKIATGEKELKVSPKPPCEGKRYIPAVESLRKVWEGAEALPSCKIVLVP